MSRPAFSDHQMAQLDRIAEHREHCAWLAHGTQPMWTQPRFAVEIARPDGTVERTERIGGTSVDAATDAMERGGLGSVVRVRPCVVEVSHA